MPEEDQDEPQGRNRQVDDGVSDDQVVVIEYQGQTLQDPPAPSPGMQTVFDDLYLKEETEPKPSLWQRIKPRPDCSKRGLWKLLTAYIPVVKVIRDYKPKESAVVDIVGGLSVGTIHIPQSLVFGQLATLRVTNGLYTSLWPVLIYVIFGTSAHVTMGPSAVICILTAGTLAREGQAWAEDQPLLQNLTQNGTELDDIPEYMDYKEELTMTISLITGLILMVMGLLKLGFITDYLSDSFFTAFTSAAAVHIGTSQLPAMLGIQIERYAGIGKIVKSYIAIFKEIENTNIASLVIAIVVCIVIWFVKDCINERFREKMFAPIPIQLVVVIISIIMSYFGKFRERFDIKVVGEIPTGIAMPYIPTRGLEIAPNLIVDCIVMAIIIFAYTIAIAKVCAKRHNYEIDDSQEMLAYGFCNAGSAFLRCIPSCVAPPRSMVASSMNVKSTLNGIASAALMFLVIMIVTRLFTELPSAALGAIIFIALQRLFMQILDFRKYWRINKFDFFIWFFTFSCTVFLDIDIGLGVGVGVSLLTVIFQTQFSRGYRVGFTKKYPNSVEHKKYKDSEEVEGVKVFRFHSSLYFANARIFRNKLYETTVNPKEFLKALRKREKYSKNFDESCSNNEEQGFENKNLKSSLSDLPKTDGLNTSSTFHTSEKLSLPLDDQLGNRNNSTAALDLASSSEILASENLHPKNGPGLVTKVLQPDSKRPPYIFTDGNSPVFIDDTGIDTRFDDVTSANINNGNAAGLKSEITKSSGSLTSVAVGDFHECPDDRKDVTLEEKIRNMQKIHHVIVDCSPINYIDTSGMNMLTQIYAEFAQVNINLLLAGCNSTIRETMKEANFFDKFPHENIFVHVEAATEFVKTASVQKEDGENIV